MPYSQYSCEFTSKKTICIILFWGIGVSLICIPEVSGVLGKETDSTGSLLECLFLTPFVDMICIY